MHGVDRGYSQAKVGHYADGLPAPHASPRCWQPPHLRRRHWSGAVRAFGGNDGRGPITSGGTGGKGGLDPSLEMAVPPEQRPVNELSALRKSVLYSWVRHETSSSGNDLQSTLVRSSVKDDVFDHCNLSSCREGCGMLASTNPKAARLAWLQASLPLPDFMQRLGLTWAGFFTLIGGPIAYQTFDPWEQVPAVVACCWVLT